MKKMMVDVSIPVLFMREGRQIVAFSPALDIATSADDFEKAKSRFQESLRIFFEEVSAKGTLEEVLRELGWEKSDQRWNPPVIINQISETIRVPLTS